MGENGTDRKGGAAAVLALLLAVLGITYLPRQAAESGNATADHTKVGNRENSVATANGSEPVAVAECLEIFDRIKRFYGGTDYYPGSCFPDVKNPPEQVQLNPPKDLQFVIAIVPNPVQTHLPLLFDRSIGAIQQAAQDEGYTYDGSWFPWDDNPQEHDSSSDTAIAKALKEKHHRQPGILVFRRGLGIPEEQHQPYLGGLIVFLVGEQPTGGIDDIQFEHALQWMAALEMNVSPTEQNEKTFRILGPTFSGSLPSLARELRCQTTPGCRPALFPYDGISVFSGSITSDEGVKNFQNFLDSLQTVGHKSKFRTFSEGDAVMTDRFLCYLHRDGYDLSRVAILSEDQTAFGSQSTRGYVPDWKVPDEGDLRCGGLPIPQEVLALYYPRDIASLRSAYEKQSIFSAGKPQPNTNVPNTMLHGDLSESPSSEHDAVRSYAGQVTPLDQEAVLFGITNIFENKHIEFVIVRSSNTLDQLFLSEFLRRSYPGVRVVIDGSDLLLRRGMQGASLRGVMVLSTYPLLGWTQDAAPVFRANQSGSYRVFAQDISEGLYIAAREILTPSGEIADVPVGDYAPPEWVTQEQFDTATDSVATEHCRKMAEYQLKKDHEVPTEDQSRARYRPKEELERLCKDLFTEYRKKLPDERSKDRKRPATWISVVGHRQFWPVAVLNSNTEPEPPSNPSLLEPMSLPQEYWRKWVETVQLPGEMLGLLAFCLILGLWHLYCCWNGSIIGSPRARAYFAPLPRREHVILIYLGSLLIGLLGVLLALTLHNGVSVLVKYNYSVALGTDSDFHHRILALPAAFKVFGSISAVVAVSTVSLLIMIGYFACRRNYSLAVLSPSLSNLDATFSIDSCRRWALRWWPWSLMVLGLLYYGLLFSHINAANRYAIFWRGVYLRSGVSGLLPQVLLLLGLYAWFWFTLQGLSLFGADRPVLPRIKNLPDLKVPPTFKCGNVIEAGHKVNAFRMFSREEAGTPIEDAALPLSTDYLKSFAIFLLVTSVACYLALGESGLRTLGDRRFGNLVFLGVCLCLSLILADARQFLRTWSRLRQLLVFFDRLRLRRTLDSLTGLSWNSVWKMSGNVLEQRYRLLSLQFDTMRNLTNLLDEWKPISSVEAQARDITLAQLKNCGDKGAQFASWYVNLGQSSSSDLTRLNEFQEELAITAGCVMTQLIRPAWGREKDSLLIEGHKSRRKSEEKDKADTPPSNHAPDDAAEWIKEAELFFLLPYLGFIQNTIGRIRSIAMSILFLFVASTLAVSSYPFDPLPVIGAVFLITFLLIGMIVIGVYAEMHRDATLSRITKTDPGKLGLEFWVKLVAFGAGPLLGLLTTLFPSMTDFIVSFLQPGAQAIK